LAGLLMALSFPPINLGFLAFVGLVPLFIYLDKPFSLTRTARAGVLCSSIFFGITLNWINAVGAFSWLAVPGYLVIVLCHVANFFFFVLPVVALKNYLSLPFLYTAPFAWVVCERLRAHGDLAFPWTPFGYGLTKFPFLLQFADIVGIYGVSFWLVVLNVLLFEVIRVPGQPPPRADLKVGATEPARRRRYAVIWLLVFGAVNLYNAFRWFRGIGPTSGQLQVAVIQPNIPQRIKWDERYGRQILKRVFAMNADATRPATDLVVWPETAIPYYIDERRPFNLTEMGELPGGNARILTGLLDSSQDDLGQSHFYNVAALFDSRGVMLKRYKKIYLVPASEKYPFRDLVGFTRSFFSIQEISYGAMDPGEEATVFTLVGAGLKAGATQSGGELPISSGQVPAGATSLSEEVVAGAKFSALICYESAFPQLSRAYRLRGAQFLVNITNDAWFGRSFAPYQHACFLIMRAIENRTAIVRCGNTGISGFIDPLGRWQQKTVLSTEAILSGTIPLTNKLTIYTRSGDMIVYLCYGVLGLFLLMALRKKYSIW
jgi:apolipoprotein N-acyltransferase